MISSHRLSVFVTTFSTVFVVLYTFLFLMDWTLFTYFPASGRFALWRQPASADEGPAMYWYGWILLGSAGSLVVAFLATFLPENVTKKLSPHLLWLIPLCAMVVLAYGVRSYFLR